MTTISIVEDDAEFRAYLAECLEETPGYRCVCQCGSAEEAIRKIPPLRPDVVLMDINLPTSGRSGGILRIASSALPHWQTQR